MPKRKRKSILRKRAPKSKLSKLKLVPEKIIDKIDLLQEYNKVGLFHFYKVCVCIFVGKRRKIGGKIAICQAQIFFRKIIFALQFDR